MNLRAWAGAHRKQLMVGGAAGVAGLALYERKKSAASSAAAAGTTTGYPDQQVPVSWGDPQAGGITAGGFGGDPSGSDAGAIASALSGISNALGRIAGAMPGKAAPAKKPPAKKTRKPLPVSKPKPAPKPRKLPVTRHGGAPAHGGVKALPVHPLPGAPKTPRTHTFPVKAPIPARAPRRYISTSHQLGTGEPHTQPRGRYTPPPATRLEHGLGTGEPLHTTQPRGRYGGTVRAI